MSRVVPFAERKLHVVPGYGTGRAVSVRLVRDKDQEGRRE